MLAGGSETEVWVTHTQETRVLMRETVMILSPDSSSKEDVQRGNLLTPFHLETFLDPLAVLIDHGIDDMDERLVTVKQAMSS
jgi:hypothetical protein